MAYFLVDKDGVPYIVTYRVFVFFYVTKWQDCKLERKQWAWHDFVNEGTIM